MSISAVQEVTDLGIFGSFRLCVITVSSMRIATRQGINSLSNTISRLKPTNCKAFSPRNMDLAYWPVNLSLRRVEGQAINLVFTQKPEEPIFSLLDLNN